ncbi:MAG: hypothetical protein KF900_03815 [Bacteroidetes bacterium]|nr:hypothetical protein [Bacteroidota bacterium]
MASMPPLSKYEKRWAVFHPFAALRVNNLTKKCFSVYHHPDIKTQLDTFANGGKLDAFRHTFFMAAYAQKINTKKLRQLGIAHEKGNYRQFLKSQLEDNERPDSIACVMDLRNNGIGLAIGHANKKINLNELKTLVISEIKKGNVFIIKRNSLARYVDCNNNEIDLTVFSTSWFIPKCLISSLEQ